MTDMDLKILLRLVDKASLPLKKSFKGIMGGFAQVGRSFQKNWALFTVGFLAAQKAMRIVINLTKQFISAADAVEQYQVRMKVLLGTVAEGAQVFSDMKELAGQVPKTYDEIMASATDLAAVVKDGSAEIKKLMPIIVDLSAGTGMSVREVTGQMIRMYSAGAAAADMFRERGVSAALGFMPGQSVSAAETMKQIIAQWEDGSSKFAGASEELAKTFTGQVSMMDDAWFNFRANIGSWITESPEVIAGMNAFTEAIKGATGATADWAAEGGLGDLVLRMQELATWVQIATEYTWLFWQAYEIGPGWIDGVKEAYDGLTTSVQELMDIQRKQTERASLQGQQAMSKARNEAAMAAKIQKGDLAKYTKNKADETAVDKKTVNEKLTMAKSYYGFLSQTVSMAAAQNKSFAVVAQGVAIGEAIMNTAIGATKALAQLGAFGIPVAAAITALGMAQVALITQQKFHQGGTVKAHGGLAVDEVPIIAQRGEGILRRSAMDAIGGEAGLNSLNQGGDGFGGISINIEAASFREDQDVEDMATMLAEVLEEQRRARI